MLRPPNVQRQPEQKSTVLAAFSRLMRPIVKMLLRQGISFGEFAEVLKFVYVDIAAKEYALPNRKISGSRIAILTGLTRKDVKRLTDRLSAAGASVETEIAPNLNRATRVLSGWHQDPDFTGPYGVPADLPFEGNISFTELVKRYSGDMPARAMLEELERVHAVDQLENGEYRVLNRFYIASKDPKEAQYLGDVLHDLAATIEFNFDPDREEPARFERWVATDKAHPEAMPEFKAIVRESGERFLERLDTWLSMHEIEASDSSDAQPVRTRVGIYLFEEPAQDQTEDEE